MRRLLHLFVLSFALASCGSCEKESARADAGAAEAMPAAPAALLCDVVVTTPNASWHKLQLGIGGAVGILPATLPGVLITFAELDPLLADAIDGTAPMYGVLAGDPASPAYAFAMKIVDTRKARALLTDGDTARFVAREDAGLTDLVPKSRPEDRKTAIAITQNGYLLVGPIAPDLHTLAPYVTRTLPSRPVPPESAVVDVPRSAIADVLRPRAARSWQEAKTFLVAEDERMRKEKGRAPDFGDPKAIIAAIDGIVTSKLDVLGDLDRIRIALVVKDDSLAAVVTLGAKGERARAWADEMTTGDAAPFLALPLVSSIAIATRDSEKEREAQSKKGEELATSALAGRLSEDGAKRLHEVFADAAKARGEWSSAAAVAEEPSGFFAKVSVRDADAATRAMKGASELARVAPFKEMLRARDVTSSTDDVAGIGKVSVTMLTREPKAKNEKAAPPLGAAWIVDGGAIAIASGAEPAVVMRLGGKPDKKLGDDALVTRFVSDVGPASTFLALQPLRIDPRRASLPASPLMIAVGKKDKDAVIRAVVGDPLLRELARSQMGF